MRKLALVLVVAALSGSAQTLPAVADGCPSYNPPNELTLGNGTPQSAKLGAPFQTNLQVALANTDGCSLTTQLSGIAVTFAAPGSGPSGTFASSGANAVLVGTDGQGTAVAPQFSANTLPGGYLVTASSDYGSVSFSLVNTATGVPATVTPLSSKSQSASAGARYPQLLRVKVLDANGSAVAGANVTFALGSGTTGAGASFAGGMPQATATTDASGVAVSPALTANADVGRFTGTATVAGTPSAATFVFDNVAAKAPRLRAEGGAQKATVGTRYRPLEVKLLGGNGKPVQGAMVTFNLGAGASGQTTAAGATFAGGAAQATATTTTTGIAVSPHLAANTASGAFTATATATGAATAVFALRNLASHPASITAGVAASEATAPRMRFPIPLAAKVDDAHGNPVAGVAVEFTAPTRGASGRFHGGRRSVEVKTDKAGVAVAPAFVANGIEGGYVVRATARGIDHPAAFGLVNRASG